LELHRDGVIRIYDVLFHYNVLLDTDAFVPRSHPGDRIPAPDGHRRISLPAGQIRSRGAAAQLGLKDASVLATAYTCGIPIFTSSPGDSSIGMNVAAMALRGSRTHVRREP